MAKKKMAERNEKNGIVQLLEENLSPSTVENITALLADHEEFGCDLAMSPLMNVSESAGFEALLGVFGGKKK